MSDTEPTKDQGKESAVGPDSAKRNKAKRAGIAAAVIVAVIIVAALYAYTAGWFGGAEKEKPTVTFSPAIIAYSPNNLSASWNVSTVSAAHPCENYRISVAWAGSPLAAPQSIVPDSEMRFGARVVAIVQDKDGGGALTADDVFIVYNMNYSRGWRLDLIWLDDTLIVSQPWNTRIPPPSVGFTPPAKGGTSPQNHTANLTTVETTLSYDLLYFKIQISKESLPLATPAPLLVANTTVSFGSTVKVVFRDNNGDGKLNVDDFFLIYGMDEPYSWAFHLVWGPSGDDISSTSWSTP